MPPASATAVPEVGVPTVPKVHAVQGSLARTSTRTEVPAGVVAVSSRAPITCTRTVAVSDREPDSELVMP